MLKPSSEIPKDPAHHPVSSQDPPKKTSSQGDTCLLTFNREPFPPVASPFAIHLYSPLVLCLSHTILKLPLGHAGRGTVSVPRIVRIHLIRPLRLPIGSFVHALSLHLLPYEIFSFFLPSQEVIAIGGLSRQQCALGGERPWWVLGQKRSMTDRLRGWST